MISFIRINGFKSFINFEMDFTPFTIITGLHTTGKSHLFDALNFLSRLATNNNMAKAKEEGHKANSIFTQFGNNEYAREVELVVELLVNKDVADVWGNEVVLKYTRFRYELTLGRVAETEGSDLFVKHEKLAAIDPNHDCWLSLIPVNQLHKWQPPLPTNSTYPICFEANSKDGKGTLIINHDNFAGEAPGIYGFDNRERTVLSSINSADFAHILAVKMEIGSWCDKAIYTLENLKADGRIASRLMKETESHALPEILFRIKKQNPMHLENIGDLMRKFKPDFRTLDVTYNGYARKFLVKLTYKDGHTHYSELLSDAMLHLLGNCVLGSGHVPQGVQCIDEPERGIHPMRLQDLYEMLYGYCTHFYGSSDQLRQVIIFTHSPHLTEVVYNQRGKSEISLYYFIHKKQVLDTAWAERKMVVPTVIPLDNLADTKSTYYRQVVDDFGSFVTC